jgi:hypothetical protein
MRTFLSAALIFGLLPFAISSAKAQSQPSPCSESDKQNVSGFGGIPARVGCPFSATFVTTRTQTLADGTHIRTTSKRIEYRDSLGRTRVENYVEPLVGSGQGDESTPAMVEIFDRVAGFVYFFSPRDKSHVASRSPLPPLPASIQNPAPQSAPAPQPIPAQVIRPEGSNDSRPSTTKEDLGTQQIDGFSVQGRRFTTIYPIGSRHNDQPITMTRETWFSPDLGIDLLEKDTDPINGDRETDVTLDVSEPDAALFQVPADYTIRDQGSGNVGVVGSDAGGGVVGGVLGGFVIRP